jgi:hypothetical protein
MKRVSYELVALEMEKLWSVQIDYRNETAMEDHCNLLRGFVESCGWTVDDYVRRMMNCDPEVSDKN